MLLLLLGVYVHTFMCVYVRACTNKYLNIIIKVSMQIFLLISICIHNN